MIDICFRPSGEKVQINVACQSSQLALAGQSTIVILRRGEYAMRGAGVQLEWERTVEPSFFLP